MDEHSAQFTDELYHDTGIGYAAAMRDAPKQLQIAPGEFVTLTTTVQVPVANDLGRYEATLQSDDRWRYRTPTLRNVAVTAPYMHDGSLATLEAVRRSLRGRRRCARRTRSLDQGVCRERR